MKLVQTYQGSKDFQQLVTLLDAELAIRDGDDHAFYHQFNGIESLD
ncbi:MAG: GNAT family N-acetyltransferase, partial [Flavobacteriaceae bacterium]